MTTGTTLQYWWAVIDGDVADDPADLLAEDLWWSITFDGTTRSGGREDLLAYVRDRVSEGRCHRIRIACVTGPVEIVAGELLDHGIPITTFVATAERNESGQLRRYMACTSSELRMALPDAGAP
jgi:hypothetical protein